MLSRLITRKEQLVLLALAGAISVGSLALYFHRNAPLPAEPSSTPQGAKAATKTESRAGASGASEASPASPTPITTPTPPPSVTVSVTGAVRKPGVYTLDATSRIQDIIEKAGGASDDAALDELNLAAKLLDGTTLHVPVKPVWDPRSRQFVFTTPQGPSYNPPQYTRSGWADAQSTANPAATPTKSSEKGAGLINLNTATQEQLESLPGVGPKLAQQIMAQRASTPFRTVDDLDKVPGFGPRRIEQIRGLVTVR